MRDMVAHTHNAFPRHIGTYDIQQGTACPFINFFDSLSDGFKQHACGRKSFHPFRREPITVGRNDSGVPSFNPIYSFDYLKQGIDYDFLIV